MNTPDQPTTRNAGGTSCARNWLTATLLLSFASGAFAQTTSTTPATTASATPTPEEETVMLSPFEVTAETTGYYQANTMSGTRLNARLEDLGQSLSIMTKEQMADFAMLDVNDVFDYMAGAEGTGTYSDFVLDRNGNLSDNVMLSPTTANRVRGIASANIAFDNIETSRRVPLDPLWMDSVELSRGPNANIFGLGNPSGTVNQVAATANLTRDFTQIQGRVDSYDGWRTSLDVNRVLKEDVLALRANVAFQHTGYVRKPSGEDARRLSAHLKIKPWESTTLSVSVFDYNNHGTRVNFTTPRDYVSAWIQQGRPGWNPVTRVVTFANGTSNPAVSTSVVPVYFQSAGGATQRSNFFIGREDEAPYWTAPRIANGAGPDVSGSNNIRLLSSAPTLPGVGLDTNGLGQFTNQPLFGATPAVSDRTIYDWGEFNTGAANFAEDDITTFSAKLDQIFVNTPKHQLVGQFTFMREDAKQRASQPLGNNGNSGQSGQMYVDVNTHNLDGSVNPYFGRPYFQSGEPLTFSRPLEWETTRAQLAYRLDFSDDSGWTKWLGRQQLLGYYEYKDRQRWQFAWREALISNHSWTVNYAANMLRGNRVNSPGNVYVASPNIIRLWERYYVGDSPNGLMEYAPRRMPLGTFPFVWGTTGNFRYDNAEVGLVPSADETGGGRSERLIIKTTGGVLQSYFLDSRLITTFGLREDKVFDRDGVNPTVLPDKSDYDFAASTQWATGDWGFASGKTQTASFVLRPFRDVGFLNNQSSGGGGVGRFFADAVRNLGLTYNKSDNFIPAGPAVDLFLNPLPNQTGEGEDYGFWLNLLDNKLVVRFNKYENKQLNVRNGEINVIAQRVLRADGIVSNDPHNLIDRATDWIAAERGLDLVNDAAQLRQLVADAIDIPIDLQDALSEANGAGRLAAIQDVVSKGAELEVNYNPTQYWTISANASETKSINVNAASTIEDWVNLRMPIWTTIEDPRYTQTTPIANTIPTGATGHLLWRHIAGASFTGYGAAVTAAQNFATFVEGPLAVFRQQEGRPRPQIRRYAAKLSTRYNLAGMTDNRILKNVTVGGALRWEDKGAIGFYGLQSLPDRITQLDPDRPVYDKDHTYLDLFLSYRTRMFDDKVRATFQLNAKNLQESGDRIRPTAVYPDGTPVAFRIIDPRQFILSVTFDM